MMSMTKKKTTVRFGLLICQDLTHVDVLNEYIALGIRNIILSTHYSNLAPVYKMGMVFQGYSLAYDINFIASNGISSSSNGGGLFTRGRGLHLGVHDEHDPLVDGLTEVHRCRCLCRCMRWRRRRLRCCCRSRCCWLRLRRRRQRLFQHHVSSDLGRELAPDAGDERVRARPRLRVLWLGHP